MPVEFSFAYPFLEIALQVIKNWWWLFLPFFLFPPARFLYLFYIMGCWDKTIERMILEVKIPKEVSKSIKAMDQVFAGLHGTHDIPTWREKWIEGVFQLNMSFEIVSSEGNIHFYIRAPRAFRKLIESNIYSQYPEVEIVEVEDYTQKVPQDIPNKNWDIWGVNFINAKDEIFPIKTYKQFEAEIEKDENKKVDPLADFLEGISTLGPGEHFWLQIVVKPVLGRDKPWQEKGKKLVDKLAQRPEKKESNKPIIQEAAEILMFGPSEKKEEIRDIIPPEMQLTPGERNVISAVEEKLSKFGYDCCIRAVYVGKKDAFFKPNVKFVFSFFKETSTENLGGLRPLSKVMTKVKSVPFWFLDKRKLYLRKRRMFKYYTKRWSPFFPKRGGTFVLNTEELATLYHFPGKSVAPAAGVSRIETKKKGVPSNLPVE
jgi:hypothetical protein